MRVSRLAALVSALRCAGARFARAARRTHAACISSSTTTKSGAGAALRARSTHRTALFAESSMLERER